MNIVNIKNYQKKQPISRAVEQELCAIIKDGTVNERILLAKKGICVDLWMNNAYPAVRIQAALHGADVLKMLNDPDKKVRFVVAQVLTAKLGSERPKIAVTKLGVPYVISTPEREALEMLAKDHSSLVSIKAKTDLTKIKEAESREAERITGVYIKDIPTDTQMKKIMPTPCNEKYEER